jgi:sugar phosphate isomerase/epimerase
MDRIVSVSTMAFDGYPLETALDELAGLGVRYVEPASVDKVFQHLVEEDFCDARAAWLKEQMAGRGLACVSLSAHMDLSRPDSVDRFRRRLEFACAIGAQIVNTIAGPISGRNGFRTNIPAIGKRAADLGLIVALENHGDLVDRGRQIVQFIEQIGIPAVRANYDTGNAYLGASYFDGRNLFGLSMDYQVFLVSRMHEEWAHTGDNRRAANHWLKPAR